MKTGITAHPGGSGAEKVSKSALGSENFVPNKHFRTTREALDYLKSEYPNWTFVGMETTERSVEYTRIRYSTEGIVLVLGNEVTGVDPCLLEAMDSIVEIPMHGKKNSLNVAACAPGTIQYFVPFHVNICFVSFVLALTLLLSFRFTLKWFSTKSLGSGGLRRWSR